jgi:regulator of telomere elongation helicase 1
VVSVGIPFGSLGEPRVILKKEHLNNMEKAVLGGAYRPWDQMPAGYRWYQREALQAVNQALGRVVRHQEDYGILVLADSRYDQGYYNHSLSKWVRDSLSNNAQAFSYPNFIGEL